jgi:hypothetical protein
MKRFIGLGAIAGIALTALLFNVGGSPTSVSAAGIGGTISYGTVTGLTVVVNTTATTDTYNAFNVHVATNVSPGVTLTGISGSETGDTLITQGSVFCPPTVIPAVGEAAFGCTGIAGQAITTAGLLATFTFSASGDGCIQATMLTGFTDNSGFPDASRNTYTGNADDGTQQAVTVSGTAANILVGAGVIGDCGTAAATATPTATDTPPPLATATATPTATPCSALTGCPSPTPTLTPGPPINGTLTPTGTPATATSVPTDTPVPPATEPTLPGGTTPPDSGTGAGGARPGITLPDTGDGSSTAGSAWIWIIMSAAVGAMGLGALALSRRKA